MPGLTVRVANTWVTLGVAGGCAATEMAATSVRRMCFVVFSCIYNYIRDGGWNASLRNRARLPQSGRYIPPASARQVYTEVKGGTRPGSIAVPTYWVVVRYLGTALPEKVRFNHGRVFAADFLARDT